MCARGAGECCCDPVCSFAFVTMKRGGLLFWNGNLLLVLCVSVSVFVVHLFCKKVPVAMMAPRLNVHVLPPAAGRCVFPHQLLLYGRIGQFNSMLGCQL